MNYCIFLLIVALLPIAAQAQNDKRSIHKGNELYRQQKYAEAEASYQQSLAGSQGSLEGNFNLGTAWYKQQKLDDAVKKFTDIAASAPDKAIKAKAYHNLGNALLESQKLEESIDAYKKSLINNPKDDETRYNLAYAQEKLKQQQQQDQDNKDNKDNKDQNKDKNDKDNKDKQDQQKDDKDQNKDNKDKEEQNKDQKDGNDDKKDQDKGNQDQQQPQPGQLSKADAERLLEAMNQEEKNTQDKLKDKKAVGKGKVVKQW